MYVYYNLLDAHRFSRFVDLKCISRYYKYLMLLAIWHTELIMINIYSISQLAIRSAVKRNPKPYILYQIPIILYLHLSSANYTDHELLKRYHTITVGPHCQICRKEEYDTFHINILASYIACLTIDHDMVE